MGSYKHCSWPEQVESVIMVFKFLKKNKIMVKEGGGNSILKYWLRRAMPRCFHGRWCCSRPLGSDWRCFSEKSQYLSKTFFIWSQPSVLFFQAKPSANCVCFWNYDLYFTSEIPHTKVWVYFDKTTFQIPHATIKSGHVVWGFHKSQNLVISTKTVFEIWKYWR